MSNFEEVTYSTYQVQCESPRIIINPLLPELIAKYHTYYMRGSFHRDPRVHIHYFAFDYRPFSVKRHGITREDISDCYVVDETTGETFPIYMEVPCNHCAICKERKINSFVQRCKLETLCYDNKPWFGTLTYDEQHKPSTGVDIDECQRFLKRFRINLVRAGYKDRIRYVMVGEYGKPPHPLPNGRMSIGYRPHYHFIFWNIPAKTHQQYLEVSNILRKSWSKGNIQRRLVDPSNDKTFYYTAKYLRKDCYVPQGCNPTFCLSSRGHGGIGSKFLDGIAPELRRTLNCSFKYLNKWSNKVEELVFSQYVLNRIFPSWSKSVPSVLRRALADFGLGASCYLQQKVDLFTNQIKKLHEEFNSYFAEHVYYPTLGLGDIGRKVREVAVTDVECLLGLSQIVLAYKDKIDFVQVQVLADKRNVFISNLFRYVTRTDISARSYKARRNQALAVSRLII